MLTYRNGSPVQVGDSVLIENGKTPGTVVEVVESLAEMTGFGVDVPGVMVKSAPFGLVYLPVESLLDDPLQFVARQESQ